MKNLLALAALAVLVVVAVGYTRGWYHVKATPEPNGQYRVTTDIDSKKIKQDVQTGKEKVAKILNNQTAPTGTSASTNKPATTPAVPGTFPTYPVTPANYSLPPVPTGYNVPPTPTGYNAPPVPTGYNVAPTPTSYVAPVAPATPGQPVDDYTFELPALPVVPSSSTPPAPPSGSGGYNYGGGF